MEKTKINVAEFAEMYGISQDLAYRLIREGKVPAVKIGSRIILDVKRLEEWYAEKERKNTPGEAY